MKSKKPVIELPSGAVVAGVDEAGVGALAGPVVAAAVVLNPVAPAGRLKDSKLLSPSQREHLAAEIKTYAVAWSIAFVAHTVVDSINILQARLYAMRLAVERLAIRPDQALIDGDRLPAPFGIELKAIVDGDDLVPEISAASILAKTARDAWMERAAIEYPGYGFEKHFGYSTEAHKAALERLGPCAIHRRTYEPVRNSETLFGSSPGLTDAETIEMRYVDK
ncbi:MAG: ribonuclease HII [bacterium]|jgi:ribonuclease HII